VEEVRINTVLTDAHSKICV